MKSEELLTIMSILIVTLALLVNSWHMDEVSLEIARLNQALEFRTLGVNDDCYVENATVTGYTACKGECNGDFKRNALMEKPIVGLSCAVSRDLMRFLGKKVYIPGIGIRHVDDLMNARFSRSIDILMPSVQNARTFGRQTKNIVFIK